jgi:hypothetical protein
VRELFRDGRVELPDGETVTVATFEDVEPGTYLIFAKTTVEAGTAGAEDGGSVRCSLNGVPTANTTSDDTAETEYGRRNETATLATQITQAYSQTGSARLRCLRTSSSGKGDVVARETKIILVPIGSTTRVEG